MLFYVSRRSQQAFVPRTPTPRVSYVALTGLELSMYTSLTADSEISLSLQCSGIKGIHHTWLCFCFKGRFLCSLGWDRTYFVDQAGLKLDILVSQPPTTGMVGVSHLA